MITTTTMIKQVLDKKKLEGLSVDFPVLLPLRLNTLKHSLISLFRRDWVPREVLIMFFPCKISFFLGLGCRGEKNLV